MIAAMSCVTGKFLTLATIAYLAVVLSKAAASSIIPGYKLWINRCANLFIRFPFRIKPNDITNAFKAYRREVIAGCRPFLSPHFNLTVEIPLKAIVRGYTWTVIPITWRNRRTGTAKLKIKEMGSRYLLYLPVYLARENTSAAATHQKDTREHAADVRETLSPR